MVLYYPQYSPVIVSALLEPLLIIPDYYHYIANINMIVTLGRSVDGRAIFSSNALQSRLHC